MHSMGHIKFSVMPTTSSISHRNTFSYFVDYSMKKPPTPPIMPLFYTHRSQTALNVLSVSGRNYLYISDLKHFVV